MAWHYLRLEGVNLTNILDDTQDLSTIRGSSLMLLRVVDSVDEWLATQPGVKDCEAVTTGASIGIWRFNIAGEPTALLKDLRKELLSEFCSVPTQHATFVIDAVAETDDGYAVAREALIARNRWQQMQTSSVVYPALQMGTGVCELDLKRPAMAEEKWIKGKLRRVSASVWDRRAFGIEAKQEFYRDELALAGLHLPYKLTQLGKHPFAYHFGSICEPQRDGLRRALSDKIAIFYADANRLSGIQNELVADNSQTEFGNTALVRQQNLDKALKAYRRDFLAKLLTLVVAEGAVGPPHVEEATERGSGKASGVVRLETLLWGGDEFMFVMPARLGFAVAKLFFDTSRDWKLGDRVLHHAAALVFCHHDAPIAPLRRLAGDLADHAKEVDRGRSLLMPVVLESFDHIGRDLKSYFRKRLPKGLSASEVPLSPDAVACVLELAKICQSNSLALPRGRLRVIVQAMFAEADGIQSVEYRARDSAAMREFPHLGEPFAKAEKLMHGTEEQKRAAVWLALEDYWDYLLPDMPDARTDA
jgi:hypothetical protein